MAAYVRFMRRIDFRAICTLSYVGWKQALQRSPFRDAEIRSPSLPDADLNAMRPIKRGLALAYNRLVANRVGQTLMRAVGPLFQIVATRSGEPQPSPPPRPETML